MPGKNSDRMCAELWTEPWRIDIILRIMQMAAKRSASESKQYRRTCVRLISLEEEYERSGNVPRAAGDL